MSITIGNYLLTRLHELGIQHIFGVPGDYNLGLLDEVVNSKNIKWIGSCNELNAAYAADGYARIKGAGALITTFGVGELSAINGIAGSYAEFAPVVKIVGTPALSTQARKALVHHTLGSGDFNVFANMYSPVTAAQALLTSNNATAEIDRVLRVCWLKKQPVYIALPADIVHLQVPEPKVPLDLSYPVSNPDAVAECISQIATLIKQAKHPIILADICASRHPMRELIHSLLDQTGIPFATMNMGKGVVNESHLQYTGIYNGDFSCAGVQERVETSDCIVSFGSILSDFNTGGFTSKLNANATIEIHSSYVQIKHAKYHDLYFNATIPALIKSLKGFSYKETIFKKKEQVNVSSPQNKPVKHEWLWPRIGKFWQSNSIVIAEVGSPLFGSVQVRLPDNATYISQPLWSSIGYSVGALLGTALAAPNRRSILLVGDGSFQLTAQEISTVMRNNLYPIICLINNDGYTVERAIHGANQTYNDIQMWQYAELPKIFGDKVWSTKVSTEVEVDKALQQAESIKDKLVFIEIVMEKLDMPEIMARVGEACAKQNQY